MKSIKEYADIYLASEDQIRAQADMEDSFIRELASEIRRRNLIHTSQLIPLIEDLQQKWMSVVGMVRECYSPGQLSINPAGFLEGVRSFFPGAYFQYRQIHP